MRSSILFPLVAVCAFLGSSGLAGCTAKKAEGAAVWEGRPSPVRLVYYVDLPVARDQLHGGDFASDEDLAEEIRRRAQARVDSLLPGVAATVTFDEGRRLVVDVPAETPAAEQQILDSALRSQDRFEFFIVAAGADDLEPRVDLQAEKQRVRQWSKDHPGSSLAVFNRLPREEDGAHPGLWAFAESRGRMAVQQAGAPQVILVRRPAAVGEYFGAGDMARVTRSQDSQGFPALGFELADRRKQEFCAFTEENTGRLLAIVINGQVHSSPIIDEPLPGEGIIRGMFTAEDVDGMIRELRREDVGGALTLLERLVPPR